MTKRRRARGIWASDLPRIRDGLAEDLTDNATELRAEGRDDDARILEESRLLQMVKEADLWWVSEPMTRLAHASHQGLPEWTPHLARPSLSGIIIWHRGTGLTTPWVNAPREHWITSALTPDPQPPSVTVDGFLWATNALNGLIAGTPLTADPRIPDGFLAWPTATSFDHMQEKANVADRIWDFVGATWLLAGQPTIGVHRPPRDDEMPTLRRGTDPSRIKVIALREIARADQPSDPDPDATPGARTPPRRHLVRGFWRQQACGPSRQWRKPIYVAPFLRGRGDLVTKETVHVWRR